MTPKVCQRYGEFLGQYMFFCETAHLQDWWFQFAANTSRSFFIASKVTHVHMSLLGKLVKASGAWWKHGSWRLRVQPTCGYEMYCEHLKADAQDGVKLEREVLEIFTPLLYPFISYFQRIAKACQGYELLVDLNHLRNLCFRQQANPNACNSSAGLVFTQFNEAESAHFFVRMQR